MQYLADKPEVVKMALSFWLDISCNKPMRKQMTLSFWLDISRERSPVPRAGGHPPAWGCSVGVHRWEAANASSGLHQLEDKIDHPGIRLHIFKIGRVEIKKCFQLHFWHLKRDAGVVLFSWLFWKILQKRSCIPQFQDFKFVDVYQKFVLCNI
jgi:hypothetical protein